MKTQGATSNKKDTTQDSLLSYIAWISISLGAGGILWAVAGIQGALN